MNNYDLIVLLKEFQALPQECEWIEFKVNNANPQEIGEYLSALSNSACYHNQKKAYLVYGIEDASHRLVGSSFKPKKEKVGNQEIENWLATQLSPKVDFRIYEFEYEEKEFAIFEIDATISTPVSFKGIPYIRIGSIKKKLDEHPERERKIWNKSSKYVFEKEIAYENATEEQVLQCIDYPKFFELLKLRLPDNRKGIIEKLIQEQIIVREREKDKFSITNLGAILFAKELSTFEYLSRKAIRVVQYKGNSRIKTQKEQLGIRGYAVSFEGLINYILNIVPSNEVIGKAFRTDVPMFPIIALRELIANAIIHQDFSVKGTSPMIEIFDNRIEITNAGNPLVDTMRFLDHAPISRNEILARFMRRLNICEERGSGIDKVIDACEMYQLPAPKISAEDNFTRITLYAHKTLREMEKQEKVRACYYHACLKVVSGEIMTNQTLRERFGIEEGNYPMASRIIADTLQEGLIKDFDPDNKSKKHSKYIPFWA
jgi:predicted HTH transcriptional regulator